MGSGCELTMANILRIVKGRQGVVRLSVRIFPKQRVKGIFPSYRLPRL